MEQKEKDALQIKWVVNVSDRDLTPDETSLLKRGLNFAVTPSSLPGNEYVIGIESACRFLGAHTKQAETLRFDCVKILKHATLHKPNITRKEKEALHNLATDSTITILPADKGRAVVVMNSVDYKQKAKNILSDT